MGISTNTGMLQPGRRNGKGGKGEPGCEIVASQCWIEIRLAPDSADGGVGVEEEKMVFLDSREPEILRKTKKCLACSKSLDTCANNDVVIVTSLRG